jgi:hypothetical protein
LPRINPWMSRIADGTSQNFGFKPALMLMTVGSSETRRCHARPILMFNARSYTIPVADVSRWYWR